MLPAPDLEVAAASVPVAGSSSGGDWWHVSALPDGRALLALGDVVGHGDAVAAPAATWARVVAELADVGYRLEELAAELRLLSQETEELMSTAVLVTVEHSTGSARMISMGHWPPVLLPPAGPALARLDIGPPLGAAYPPGADRAGECRVGRCGGVVLFSDGVVDERGEAPDEMAAPVVGALAAPGDCAQLCAAVLGLRSLPGEDDCTVVAARWSPSADA